MELIKERIDTIKMPLVVEICEKFITFKEVMNLHIGDVVRLDGTKITENFKLKIGKRKKFLCRPGRIGNHIAVQIGKELNEIPDDMYIAKRKLEERNQEGRQIL